MNLSQALSLLRWSIKTRGFAETAKLGLRKLSSSRSYPQDESIHPFDQKHGVDTGGFLGGGRLAAAGGQNAFHNAGYYGISPSRFQTAIERWNEYLPANGLTGYSFIDLGCGKGRALMLASEYPFREVIGIELNPDLASIAADNIKIWLQSNRSQCPIQVLAQDVAAFAFPQGPCAVYLYNPFGAPVVQQLISNIEQQFGARSGILDILYVNPVAADLFAQHPGFSLLWSGTLPLSAEDAVVDRITAADELCNIYRWNPLR
jgi:SAM-dependent methyltransferase